MKSHGVILILPDSMCLFLGKCQKEKENSYFPHHVQDHTMTRGHYCGI